MVFKPGFKGKPEQEGEFGLLPEGIYFATVTKTKETESSKGDPMVVVDFTITQGPYQGMNVRNWIVFNEDMEGRNKHLLKVLGQPSEGNPTINPVNWENQELRIRIRHRDYKGSPRNNITEFLYFEEQELEKEVKETKEKKEKGFGEGTPPPSEPPAEELSEGEDDLPF